MENITKTLVHVAFSGASGAQYGVRLVECLLASNAKVCLYLTKVAKLVLSLEMGINFNTKDMIYDYFKYDGNEDNFKIYQESDWTAPVASGTGINGVLVVCPCSMGMLSAISIGASNNLIERACDVAIKEKKKLILVPRETPLSTIHLENMLKLSKMGVCILPANPGFYQKPASVNELIDFIVARILDQIGIKHSLIKSWGR
ncbi:MAG: UbiX family flavin prenyltransferase [Legionellales bacterium]|nr:UbiX family flavin prenyltransferase [Legionellales bacterium]